MPATFWTPSDIALLLAERAGLTEEQAKAFLNAQLDLAVEHANTGFLIPGIGRVVLLQTPKREMVMRFGPDAGKVKVIPAKKTLKFRSSTAARQAFYEPAAERPDLFAPVQVPAFEFSTKSSSLDRPTDYLADLQLQPVMPQDDDEVQLSVRRLPEFTITTGRIVASDLLTGGAATPFATRFPNGRHSLALIEAGERVAFAVIRFSEQPVVRWELATVEEASHDDEAGYAVDSGTGSFFDPAAGQLAINAEEADLDMFNVISQAMAAENWVQLDATEGSIAVFSSGGGDGRYDSYIGFDIQGNVAALMTHFNVVDWTP